MSLLTLEESGPIVLRERSEQARQTFRNAVVPVYAVLSRHKPTPKDLRLVGSAVLLSGEGRKYVATAAHVIDELDNSSLWIPRGDDLWPLHGKIIQSATPPGGRRQDVVDCSWLEIDSHEAGRFKAEPFVTESAISFNRNGYSERFYMAYGYPRSKNKKNINTVAMQARSYSGCSAEPISIPGSLRTCRKRHIFMECDSKVTEEEDGTRRNAIAPAGMSGGALIDLGRFSDPKNAATSSAAPPLLAGILLEYHKTQRLLVALDIQVLIQGMKDCAL